MGVYASSILCKQGCTPGLLEASWYSRFVWLWFNRSPIFSFWFQMLIWHMWPLCIVVSIGFFCQNPQKILPPLGLCKHLAVVFSHSLFLWVYCFPMWNVTYLNRSCISVICSKIFPIICVLFQLNLLQHRLSLKGFCIQTFFLQYLFLGTDSLERTSFSVCHI